MHSMDKILLGQNNRNIYIFLLLIVVGTVWEMECCCPVFNYLCTSRLVRILALPS